MSNEAVAQRYARAIFELAREANSVSEVTKGLTAYAEAYEVSSEFRDVEFTPGLTEEARAAVVQAIGKQLQVDDLVLRSVTMLMQRQRLAALPNIQRLVEEMADEHLGVLRASVTSAKALPESYRSRLRQKIEAATGKKVLITFSEDSSLIAGIVTQVGDRVVDGSVRGKLNQLADSLQQT
jgi:F-type H+-transporting ATPase subunit delta